MHCDDEDVENIDLHSEIQRFDNSANVRSADTSSFYLTLAIIENGTLSELFVALGNRLFCNIKLKHLTNQR